MHCSQVATSLSKLLAPFGDFEVWNLFLNLGRGFGITALPNWSLLFQVVVISLGLTDYQVILLRRKPNPWWVGFLGLAGHCFPFLGLSSYSLDPVSWCLPFWGQYSVFTCSPVPFPLTSLWYSYLEKEDHNHRSRSEEIPAQVCHRAQGQFLAGDSRKNWSFCRDPTLWQHLWDCDTSRGAWKARAGTDWSLCQGNCLPGEPGPGPCWVRVLLYR